MIPARRRRLAAALALAAAACLPAVPARAELPDAIARVKPSVVLVGYHRSTDSPRFRLGGTGFVVGDGNLVATNAHVLQPAETVGDASLTVQVSGGGALWQARPARVLEVDRAHDLALLRIEGPPVPALALRNSDTVREGQSAAFMGFPIGGALGFAPVTHRATVSSIAAVALPAPSGQQLTARLIRSARDGNGNFDIFQLDGTAYPGNSGGPLFDPDSGEVIGVVNMTLLKSTREGALSNPSGISYAIPSNFVDRLIKQRRPGD
ncbi:MAG: serine protease [Xylophilus ampelinus]